MSSNYSFKLAITGALLSLLSIVGHAFSAQSEAEWSNRYSSGYFLSTDADFDGGREFSSQYFFISGSTQRTIGNGSTIGLGLNYTAIDYDFSGYAIIPWERADFLTLSAPLTMEVGEKGRFNVLGSIGTASEASADFAEGVTLSAIASYMHTFSQTLSLGLGSGYVYGLENSRFFPLLLVRWQIADHLLLTNPFRPGPFGPAGLELSYRFNEQFDCGFGGVYRNIRFALDSNSEVAPSGFAEIEGIPVFVRASWAVTKVISFDGYLGMTLNGQMNIDDSNGHELSQEDYNAQPIIGLNISGRL